MGRLASTLVLFAGAAGLVATTCSAEGDDVAAPATTSIAVDAAPTTATVGATVTTSPGEAAPGEVQIYLYEFTPRVMEVEVGDTVTWKNYDEVDHWVLTPGLDAIDSATLEEGNSYSVTFSEAGTFEYFCNIHNTMTGTVVVR